MGAYLYSAASGRRQCASQPIVLLNLHGSHSLATLPDLQLWGWSQLPVHPLWLAPGSA